MKVEISGIMEIALKVGQFIVGFVIGFTFVMMIIIVNKQKKLIDYMIELLNHLIDKEAKKWNGQ